MTEVVTGVWGCSGIRVLGNGPSKRVRLAWSSDIQKASLQWFAEGASGIDASVKTASKTVCGLPEIR